MVLRPTHGDESALLRFIDSKQVTRDHLNYSKVKTEPDSAKSAGHVSI